MKQEKPYENMERLAGVIMTFAIVGLAILLRDGWSWWMALPSALIVVSVVMFARTKVLQWKANRDSLQIQRTVVLDVLGKKKEDK